MKPKLNPALGGLLALPLMFAACSTSTLPGSVLTSGFQADAPSYQVVDLPLEQRQDVIKVRGADTQWAIVTYSLKEYQGKEITIQFSADVKRTGAAGNLNWQVNNAPDYPTVAYLENAAAGVWHHMRGRRVVTPVDNNPVLYLTNWENNAHNTIYYIANIILTIEEGSSISPNLALPPLKSAYKNDFRIGTILGSAFSSGHYFELLKHHCNVVTSIETYPIMLASAGRGKYRWEMADMVVNLAGSNNIPVHGHVLAWHEASPAWITKGSRAEVISNLEQYITDVLTHFKGRIASWDVVNEAIRDNLSSADAAGDWRKCVRSSENPWFDALGADYIEIAFRAARAADPDITLYYNDYFHYEWNNGRWYGGPNKPEAVRKMIEDINTRYKIETGGVRNLIEGVGTQSHFMGMDVNPDNVRLTLEKFKTLGVEIAVSELDISTAGYVRGEGNDSVMTAQDEMKQAESYAKLFNVYREYAPYISRVTFWGIDDGTSWLSAGNPCILTGSSTPKKPFTRSAIPPPSLPIKKIENNYEHSL
jgi:endo-1,4-beta-xylanase